MRQKVGLFALPVGKIKNDHVTVWYVSIDDPQAATRTYTSNPVNNPDFTGTTKTRNDTTRQWILRQRDEEIS